MNLIKQRTNADFVRQVINDESKTALVMDTIDSAIASLGAGWWMTWQDSGC
jgi:plasmid segregation protein ParM